MLDRARLPGRVTDFLLQCRVTLAELRALDGGSVLAREWIGEMAARRAAASETGSDGAAWLNGKPARAMACDAAIIPVVTGQIDPPACHHRQSPYFFNALSILL